MKGSRTFCGKNFHKNKISAAKAIWRSFSKFFQSTLKFNNKAINFSRQSSYDALNCAKFE